MFYFTEYYTSEHTSDKNLHNTILVEQLTIIDLCVNHISLSLTVKNV